MIVHEGITMVGYVRPDWAYSDIVQNLSGVVIEEPSREEAGMGMEPSGHWFMNYRDTTTFTFHPYSGGAPVPCKRPRGFTTRKTND